MYPIILILEGRYCINRGLPQCQRLCCMQLTWEGMEEIELSMMMMMVMMMILMEEMRGAWWWWWLWWWRIWRGASWCWRWWNMNWWKAFRSDSIQYISYISVCRDNLLLTPLLNTQSDKTNSSETPRPQSTSIFTISPGVLNLLPLIWSFNISQSMVKMDLDCGLRVSEQFV